MRFSSRASRGGLAFREDPSAHVATVQRGDAKFIRVNNFYTLGGSGALVPERSQTMIPLLTHPAPREIFFLGMGTGISAGAGLFANPDRVTVCELLPDVVDFAERWFQPYTNGLFTDPRVNTDDRPLIEYLAPRTHLAVTARTAHWLTGPERDRLYADLLDALPAQDDPHLARLSPTQHTLPRAGAIYAEWRGLRSRDDLRAGRLWQDFIALTPPHARNPDSPAGQVATGGMAFGDAMN